MLAAVICAYLSQRSKFTMQQQPQSRQPMPGKAILSVTRSEQRSQLGSGEIRLDVVLVLLQTTNYDAGHARKGQEFKMSGLA